MTLTDHQKELIKTEDEYTKAKTLAQAITDYVGNMNAELAKTDAGQVKKAQMAFASLQTAIGTAIAPYQEFINMFGQLGFAVSGVGQAEGFFVRSTKAVQDAMFARVEAAEAEMRKALEAEGKVNRGRHPLKCIDTNLLHSRLFVTP